ncbi:MAG TPA: exosortase A [Steroidobacteraceae bacterium]|nr:exosortase A [Steroidobacteraceae bacterium]
MGRVSTTFLGVVAVVVAGLAAYWPTVRSLLAFWNDYDNLTYSHGYLVAVICGWLLWRARFRLAGAASPSWTRAGVAALLALSFAWTVAYVAGIEVLHQLLLPALLLAGIWVYAGRQAATVALLPIGYLIFAIPAWDQVNGVLQGLTVFAVTTILKAIAIPARFDDNVVHLASGSFEIAGGCSGLHFVIVALAIAVLYGELGHDTRRNRVSIVLIALAMAIAMNWVRVATIILAGYLTDMQSFLVRIDHYYFGWALFALLLLVFFWGVPRWLDLDHGGNRRPAVPACTRGRRADLVALVPAVLALLLMPSLVTWASARQTRGVAGPPVIEPAIAGWEGPLQADDGWDPVYAGADSRLRAAYRRNGQQVEVYVAAYAFQAQGKEIVGYGNSLLGEGRWRSRSSASTTGGPRGTAWLVATDPAGGRWTLAREYLVAGRSFSNGWSSKLYYPLAMLAGRPESRVIAVAARCGDDCAAASEAVSGFMDDAGATLRASVVGNGAQR